MSNLMDAFMAELVDREFKAATRAAHIRSVIGFDIPPGAWLITKEEVSTTSKSSPALTIKYVEPKELYK